MRKAVIATFVLTTCLFAAIFIPISEASATSVPSIVRLFDSKSLNIHGYIVYRYNYSTTPAEDVSVSMDLWASNFWSDVSLSRTSPRADLPSLLSRRGNRR